MYTECTSPSAPFYNADLALLRFLEMHGVDMPCGDILPFMLLVTCGVVVVAFMLISSIWYVWTHSERNDPYGMKARRTRRDKKRNKRR